MSEHDDTLLDEDLGDEEYDLGNDEEEALLADDYEVERQNSYKGEEETDDVLDLGVTDALDDLEAEDENIEFSRGKTDMHNKHDFYNEGEQQDTESTFYKQQDANVEYEGEEQDTTNPIGKGDLREKLQKNVQKVYVGNGQGLEDDDGEEAKERRNRFQSERTMISPKMNNDIPDSLENVVTSEPLKPSFRGRGRGRGIRGIKAGRFIPQNSGNFNPRFSTVRNTPFDNQQQICRPPLLEARPPFLLGVPNNMQNQQIIYQQNNPQVQAFQQFSSNAPLQGPAHFMDARPQFNPNQFQGPLGPRAAGPRLEFGPRGPMGGLIQGPPFNCAPNQPFNVQIQAAPFQNQGAMMQDNPPRHMPGNQPPLLHSAGSTGGSLLGTPPNPIPSGSSAVMLPNNQILPLQGNQAVPMQDFPRPQAPNQGPPIQNHPNVQMPNQSTFENRPPFQDQHFENRPSYDSRPGYSDQITNSQFNTNNVLHLPQQSCSNIPNVSLPPGHKILINPHFRGAVQPSNETRLPWDSTQHPAQIGQTQMSSGQFTQNTMSYQNQSHYNQSQQSSTQYQQNYQQNKSDDPYAYFSDVWQENKPQKTQSSGLNKQYSSESNYSRDSSYSESKYKSDSQWEQRDNYQEDSYRGSHQSYRDRESSSRSRSDYSQKIRTPSSNVYRNDSYDQNHMQKCSNSKSMSSTARVMSSKLAQKRLSDMSERPVEDLSAKKSKAGGRNLQEVRTIDSLNERVEDKKDEEDPEMQEYRKKMEEQKRLREKILREKENRRKMAAMEKQNEENKIESSGAGSEGSQQEAKPVSVLLGVVKDAAAANRGRPGLGRGRGRPASAQTAEVTERAPGTRIIRTIQTIKPSDSTSLDNAEEKNNKGITSGQASDKITSRQVNPQIGNRRVVIQKPLHFQKIATTIQKTVSNLQKGQVSAQSTVQKVVQTQAGSLKKSQVAQKISNNAQRIVAPKVMVNTQSNQRVVLQKVTVPMKKTPEIKTNTVKLENLAASTSEAQIRRMCQGIGTIESIQMGEGNATIVFKTQSAAMVFHKKYQRKMLDLSLITVRLVPQTNANKATTTAVAKKS